MKAAKPSQQQQSDPTSFWDHLDQLRMLLIKALIALTVLAILFFATMPFIFNRYILAPCDPSFITYRWLDAITCLGLPGLTESTQTFSSNINLININLASQLMLHITTSMWLALIAGAPVILSLTWQFIAPGLYSSERRPIKRALIAGSLLFYAGAFTAYILIFPLTLRFLAGYQLSAAIPNVISIDSYMDTLTSLCLMMGVVFELPALAWSLGKMNLIDRTFFTTYRRHAIVVLMVLAALITPTGDPFTLFVVFIPLYILWESSAWLTPRKPQATA